MIESSVMEGLLRQMYDGMKTMRTYNCPELSFRPEAVQIGNNWVPRVLGKSNPLEKYRRLKHVRMYTNRLGIVEVGITLSEDWTEKAQFFVDNGYKAKILLNGEIGRLDHPETASFMESLVKLNKNGYRILPNQLRIFSNNPSFSLEIKPYKRVGENYSNIHYLGVVVENEISIQQLQEIINNHAEIKGKVELLGGKEKEDRVSFDVKADSEFDALNAYRIILISQSSSTVANTTIASFSTSRPVYRYRVGIIPVKLTKKPRCDPLPWEAKKDILETPGLMDIATIELNKGGLRIIMSKIKNLYSIKGSHKKIPEIVEQITS